MRRIGVVLKSSEERAISLGEEISAFIRKNGKDVLLEASCKELAHKWNATATDHISDEADLLVVLGGDGTILHAVHLLNDRPIPVLGINLGRVGYIAEVSPQEAIAIMESEAGTRLDPYCVAVFKEVFNNDLKAKDDIHDC